MRYEDEEVERYKRELREEEERVACCQSEIKRLHNVCRELQKEINRYKTIAYNAIKEGQIEERLSHNKMLAELGMTEEEYQAITEE